MPVLASGQEHERCCCVLGPCTKAARSVSTSRPHQLNSRTVMKTKNSREGWSHPAFYQPQEHGSRAGSQETSDQEALASAETIPLQGQQPCWAQWWHGQGPAVAGRKEHCKVPRQGLREWRTAVFGTKAGYWHWCKTLGWVWHKQTQADSPRQALALGNTDIFLIAQFYFHLNQMTPKVTNSEALFRTQQHRAEFVLSCIALAALGLMLVKDDHKLLILLLTSQVPGL